MVAGVPESQLREATIVRREVIPHPIGLPAAAKRARALQPGVAVAQGHSRGVVEALRAGATVGNVLTAAASWTSEGEAAAEAREAREVSAGTGGHAGPRDFAGEQIQ